MLLKPVLLLGAFFVNIKNKYFNIFIYFTEGGVDGPLGGVCVLLSVEFGDGIISFDSF